jgi:hypothetical protein
VLPVQQHQQVEAVRTFELLQALLAPLLLLLLPGLGLAQQLA